MMSATPTCARPCFRNADAAALMMRARVSVLRSSGHGITVNPFRRLSLDTQNLAAQPRSLSRKRHRRNRSLTHYDRRHILLAVPYDDHHTVEATMNPLQNHRFGRLVGG